MKSLMTLNAGKIQIGPDRVTINYLNAQGQAVSTNHMVIFDITPDGGLVISVGDDKSEPMLETKITVHADGMQGGYYFEARILEVKRLTEKANMKVWVTSPPVKARRHYNRRTFRLDVSLGCKLRWKNNESPEEHSAEAVVVDLSFSGCRVVAKLDGERGFPVRSFVEADQQWIDIEPPDDFVEYELGRQEEAASGGRGNGARRRTEPDPAEIIRKFRYIPINVIRFDTTRTRRGKGDPILIIGIFFAETPHMTRLLSYLERKMLQVLNIKRD